MTIEAPHKERTHSIMGGSRAPIYYQCSGYFSIIKDLPPQESTEYADEGTLFHELMEVAVDDFLQHKIEGTDPDIRLHLMHKKEGVTDDMLADVEECKNLLWEKGLDKHVTGKVYFLEEKFVLETVGDVEIGGPIDFAFVHKDKKGLRGALVLDYKYGYKFVEVKRNLQLILYGCSIYMEFKRLGKPLAYVRVAVLQPRAGGEVWREEKYSAQQLEGWCRKFVKIAHDVFLHKKIKFKAGDHCQWCPGKPACGEHKKYLEEKSNLLLARSDALLPKPELLTDDQLVKILTYKDQISDFLKACYSHALTKHRAGKKIPGFKVVEGTAKRKWKEEDTEIAEGLKKEGVKDPWREPEPQLRTITDIEKELKKLKGSPDAAKACLENYTNPGNKPQILVPETDPRPSLGSYKDLLATE